MNPCFPRIGQGTMGVGGYFERDDSRDAEQVRLLRLGVDLGMTLIDTAEIYGAGHSEELVGQAIRGVREKVFLATKFSPEHSTAQAVLQAAEKSLRRLNTDYIDLYQAHWPNPTIPIEETLGAMEKLVQDGKVRYLGLSNFSVQEIEASGAALQRERIVSLQHEYNLTDRTVEQALLPYCRQQKLTFMAYSPLMQGKMVGGDSRRETLLRMAQKYGISAAQLILAWLLRDSCVVVIPKASNEKHLRENAQALDRQIDLADFQAIEKLYAMDIQQIPTDRIEVASASQQKVYRTLEEAIENRFQLVPSPAELARQISAGEMLKPIKLRVAQNGFAEGARYQLIEGRVRYWAWVIAHGTQVPIPALVEEKGEL